ncbi:membrane protein related to metalloendopeptidase [Gracilibacillus boraciitolerans JCM 21714]|uniref:Membrane protein related to metalloendopeptidase n=1 Tax=Gracilibacillus boraciitolerans JCM 21714 TaxID=1298598 RepID=W4VIL8_9BACI|nr:M23 family metallopeptidase [Gracilibacillus boraciitolerans]GAE93057.1 membrane protein related to metalloendopeptidase [Gracilibacillus boraciitolerans JCM 21714]
MASIHKIETNFSQIKPMVSPVGAIGHFQFMPCTVIGWGYPTCQISSLGNANIPESALTSPSIINQYGGYGGVDGNGDGVVDMFNIYDAAYTAANYLSSNMNGSDETEAMRNAIFAYNRADWYVEKVLATYFSYTNGLMLGGEAMAEVINGSAWVVPYSKNITSSFGVRNGRNHNGIDVASGGIRGKAIVAYADGVVTYSQFNNGGGYGYKVDIDHGGAVTTHYAHMLEKGIPVGTEVKAGQVIGYVGNTGNVYSSSGGGDGTHLHFEVRISGQPVDPMQYVGQFIN